MSRDASESGPPRPPCSLAPFQATPGPGRSQSPHRTLTAGLSRRCAHPNRLWHPGKSHPAGSPDAREPPRASPARALKQSRALERLQISLGRRSRLLLALHVKRLAQNLDPALIGEQANALVLNPHLSPHLRRQQHPTLRVHLRIRSQILRIEADPAGRLRILAIVVQKLLVFPPNRDRIDLSDASIQTRYEQLFFRQSGKVFLESDRKLETTFVVHASRIHAIRRLIS